MGAVYRSIHPQLNRPVAIKVILGNATPDARVSFFRRLTEGLEAIPGVNGAAVMTGLPPFRQVNAQDTDFEGYQSPPEGPFENVDYYQTVSRDYLETMGIPVVDGRDFALSDAEGAPAVLVNETVVKTFFKGQSPIGRRIRPGPATGRGAGAGGRPAARPADGHRPGLVPPPRGRRPRRSGSRR